MGCVNETAHMHVLDLRPFPVEGRAVRAGVPGLLVWSCTGPERRCRSGRARDFDQHSHQRSPHGGYKCRGPLYPPLPSTWNLYLACGTPGLQGFPTEPDRSPHRWERDGRRAARTRERHGNSECPGGDAPAGHGQRLAGGDDRRKEGGGASDPVGSPLSPDIPDSGCGQDGHQYAGREPVRRDDHLVFGRRRKRKRQPHHHRRRDYRTSLRRQWAVLQPPGVFGGGNGSLIANQYLNVVAGQPKSPSGPYRRRELGVGGPVYIPKVYDGRNKTFWFFGFTNLDRTQVLTQYLTVPTLPERLGDAGRPGGAGRSRACSPGVDHGQNRGESKLKLRFDLGANGNTVHLSTVMYFA